MDQQKNILYAKQIMVESIYRSANIEGIGVTFPETQIICEGMSVAGHTVDEINAVTDLKKAWQWLLDNIESPIGIESLCQLNRLCGKYTVINAGHIRDMYDEPIRVPVSKDKDYYPPLPPQKSDIDSFLKSLTVEKTIDSALDLFCKICKNQYFNNGNKRTATLITNLFMIQNGLGVFSIPVQYKLEFYTLLTAYYDDNTKLENLKKFLSAYCISGNNAPAINSKFINPATYKDSDFDR